jgi:hypothetical protein
LETVCLRDFLEVKGDDVVAQVAGEGDAVAVSDLTAYAGLTDGDGAIAGDE